MTCPLPTSGPPDATFPALPPVCVSPVLPPAEPSPRSALRRTNLPREIRLSFESVFLTFALPYTLTRRAVAYMTTMPAVSPPRFAPERAGCFALAESFSKRRLTS